jgi:hypothetical protein
MEHLLCGTNIQLQRDTYKKETMNNLVSFQQTISKIDQLESTKKKNDKPLCFKHSRRHVVTNNS